MSVATGTPTDLVRFEHTFARDVPALVTPWSAAPVAEPRPVVIDDGVAADLGLSVDDLAGPAGRALLTGAGVPDTVAMAYAGHQFGNFRPLGDGRALLLGELHDVAGRRRDLHLKGSGRTPYARGGDGSAVLGPMLREHLISEAMHALGVPTTRALAVVATGSPVVRETPLPGAVLVRVAASHIRVGTVSYAAGLDDPAVLAALVDHTIARHHPEAADADRPALDLYRRVVDAQAALVARWMLLGFVHGVMNTDNMTLSGETIDYGPCAFMDAVDPATVFSSIDRGGRYAYGNQPAAAQWNLARLGEGLLTLFADDQPTAVDAATDVVTGFADRYRHHWTAGMAAKLGVDTGRLRDPGDGGAGAPADPTLADDLMTLLAAQQVDFTGFFRALAADTARDLFLDRAAFDAWAARWAALDPDRAGMDRVNPAYIPRNHRVEEALTAATAGDMGPYHELLAVVRRPFDVRAGLERYTESGTGPIVTYCGT